MQKLNEIIKENEGKNLKKYLAVYVVQYKVPVNDFEWDYRHKREEYIFDAKNKSSAFYIAKTLLKKFNKGDYLHEISIPTGTEKLELTGLMELASPNLIYSPVSNADLKSKK